MNEWMNEWMSEWVSEWKRYTPTLGRLEGIGRCRWTGMQVGPQLVEKRRHQQHAHSWEEGEKERKGRNRQGEAGQRDNEKYLRRGRGRKGRKWWMKRKRWCCSRMRVGPRFVATRRHQQHAHSWKSERKEWTTKQKGTKTWRDKNRNQLRPVCLSLIDSPIWLSSDLAPAQCLRALIDAWTTCSSSLAKNKRQKQGWQRKEKNNEEKWKNSLTFHHLSFPERRFEMYSPCSESSWCLSLLLSGYTIHFPCKKRKEQDEGRNRKKHRSNEEEGLLCLHFFLHSLDLLFFRLEQADKHIPREEKRKRKQFLFLCLIHPSFLPSFLPVILSSLPHPTRICHHPGRTSLNFASFLPSFLPLSCAVPSSSNSFFSSLQPHSLIIDFALSPFSFLFPLLFFLSFCSLFSLSAQTDDPLVPYSAFLPFLHRSHLPALSWLRELGKRMWNWEWMDGQNQSFFLISFLSAQRGFSSSSLPRLPSFIPSLVFSSSIPFSSFLGWES